MSDELEILPEEEDPREGRPFEHRPSRIVFVLTEGDSRELSGREVDDWACDGGDAEIEADAVSPLEDQVFCQMDKAELDALEVGRWYIVPNFRTHYSRSYEGEVDVDVCFDPVRPATDEEVKEVRAYGEID